MSRCGLITYRVILKKQFRKDFQLAVVFADGKRGVFDRRPYLNFECMEELRDRSRFASVLVENETASWPVEGADLAPDDLYMNFQTYGQSVSVGIDVTCRKEGARQ